MDHGFVMLYLKSILQQPVRNLNRKARPRKVIMSLAKQSRTDRQFMVPYRESKWFGLQKLQWFGYDKRTDTLWLNGFLLKMNPVQSQGGGFKHFFVFSILTSGFLITICPFQNRKISGFQSQAHHIAAGCHWWIWLHTHVGVFVHVGFQLRGESQYFTICHLDELAHHVVFCEQNTWNLEESMMYLEIFTVLLYMFGEDTLPQWNLQHEIPIRDGEIFMDQLISVLVYG